MLHCLEFPFKQENLKNEIPWYFAQICFKHDHDSLLLAVISNGFLFSLF